MSRLAVFTVTSWNYAHFAKTLAQSLREHEPDADLVLFLADKRRPDVADDRLAEFDKVIEFSELDIEDPDGFAFRYDVMEFNTAIKPSAFLRMFEMGYDRVIYFDPDIILFSPLAEVHRALDAGSTTVLTPHGTKGNFNEASPNDHTFMQAGIYNLGFMALRNCPPALDTLRWWERRLRTECVSNRVSEGIFVDQKFVDLWPAYCEGTFILRHDGYNVAYWNLDHRELGGTLDAPTSNGLPVAFFHFSGLNPSDRSKLSKHQERWSPARNATLKALVNHCIDRLEANGLKFSRSIAHSYSKFSNGVPIPAAVRWLYRENTLAPRGNPFEMAEAFVNATAPVRPNPGRAVTAVAYRLWQERPDLQRAFDLGTASSQFAFAQWFAREGGEEAGISTPFIAEVQRRIAAAGLQASADTSLYSGLARFAYKTLLKVVPFGRPLYRRVPAEWRQNLLHGLRAAAWSSGTALPPPAQEQLRAGVAIIGYPFAETGVGEALRSLARTSAEAQLPMDVLNFDMHVSSRQNDRTIEPWVTNQLQQRTNVFCVNADMLSETLQSLGETATGNRYNIVRPFWELPVIHPSWIAALNRVDEVWAPTKFVRDAFASAVDRPVVHMPLAVDLPRDIVPRRSQFALGEDRLLFLFAFDMASYSTRKNPMAVIRAFEEAFGADLDQPVGLIVKTMGNGQAREENVSMLKEAMHRDPRISLIDATLERGDALNLIASCDVFVSLHRSEGYGLGIAEAMALGKAAIATDYSGSTDFLNGDVGYPVPYRLIDVKEGEYPYFVKGQQWADPDIGVAAAIMRSMAANPDEMRRKSALAAEHMQRSHSSAAIAPIMLKRLNEIWSRENLTAQPARKDDLSRPLPPLRSARESR